MLYPQTEKKNKRPIPDFKHIHRELKRKSVTLQLLWEEYMSQNPDGYRYSYFCELYYDWRQKLDLPLRQSHKAGEKMFVDFAGQTMPIVDIKTGELTPAYIFIAVLGASSYIFARAVLSCDLENWVYGEDQLEAACEKALSSGATSYRIVKSILEKGLGYS